MPTYLPPRAGVSISEDAAQNYASATVGDPVLLTLELIHPAFTQPARVVNDLRNLTATLEAGAPYNAGAAVEFIGVPFRYTKPEQSDSGAPAAVPVEIDNVSRALTELLMLARESMEPVEVIEREYLPSDTSAPHVLPPTRLELTNIVITPETVSAQLGFGNLTNRKFPPRIYTAEDFPGLAS
jgi:hypothetical protein